MLAAFLLSGALFAQAQQAPPVPATPAATAELIGQLIFRDESIDQVLALLERWTGKTILRPQALPATTFTLTMNGSITRAEGVRALETLLTLNGLAVTALDDRFLKVTALAGARFEAPELIAGTTLDRPGSGRIVSKIFQPEFLRVAEIMPQIAPLLNTALASPPVIFEKANAALITDSLATVQRIEALVTRLDQPALTGLEPRNEVIHLQHASAKEVASLLSLLGSGQHHATPGNAPAPGQTDLASTASRNPLLVRSAAETAARAPATDSAAPGVAAESASQFSALLTVLPEERSNSLIVAGTADDLRLVQELVGKIDILLAQVRIEVVIAEVTLRDDATSGISALGLTLVDNRLVGFSGAGAGFRVADGAINPATNDLSAVITLGTTPRKTNATILSQPTIITTHNKEGHIFVGESVPVISSYLSDASSTGSTGAGYRSTVTAQDIGIDLTVKPLIGPDGAVQLEIKQQVNDILGEVLIDGNPQPRVGKRSTSSFVSVRSGDILVLGGLQRTARSRNTNRLGPIPFLGDLFGTRTRENTRTDLVFFLRPTVLINTPDDNRTAWEQVELLPAPARAAVKKALEPETAP